LVHALRAQGRTFREIAAEVGVSHETVRAALRSAHDAAQGRV
jgi:DNA-binding CsgD family transcriptional regulator